MEKERNWLTYYYIAAFLLEVYNGYISVSIVRISFKAFFSVQLSGQKYKENF